jgi:hypothetical protein
MSLQAHLGWLSHYGHLSCEKQQEWLWEIGKIKIGVGTLQTTTKRLAGCVEPDELYIHMGYQKGTAFRVLLELEFDNGNLIDFKDLSDLNAQKRGAFKNYAKTRPGEVVDKSFDLNFDDLIDFL